MEAVKGDPDIIALLAFGSLATGKLSPLSDLDFAVLLSFDLDSLERFKKHIELIGVFIDNFHAEEIDLIILNEAPPRYGNHILPHGKILFCRDRGVLADFIESTRKRYLDFRPYTEEFTPAIALNGYWQVAKKLEKNRPDLAARLWRAQGLRIVNAKKSKYYDAALSNFESAKRCFERAGLPGEWEKTVSQVSADHHRKRGFMPGFERLVEGVGPSDEPSFMEQAKPRFRDRHRRAR